MAHPELPAEQSYLDKAYERLEAVRAATLAELAEAFQERGGTFQSYTERDIRVRSSLSRLEKMQLGREALIFGRIDRPAGETGAGDGAVGQPPGPATAGAGGTCGHAAAEESFHIGRLAISDAEHEPLVVDWRAPVAEPFYRATGAHPMGLRRRRHFLSAGRRILDLEDELFVPGGPERVAETLGLPGSSVLRAALERAHTGRMRDIVATVQAEQDAIIRAPLPGALVVQGGPGTGKTAVALHRAAYLLYTHRFPLESQGVLVIAPNATFLRYIDQVLPSLGETGVELSTASGLYKQARPSASEAAGTARLKGDPRMARFVRRAIRQRQRPLRKSVSIPYGRLVLILSARASEEIVDAARRRSGTHNARRGFVETLLWQHLAAQLETRSQKGATPASDGEIPGRAARTPGELALALRRRPEVAELLERMWPRLTPQDLLHDLLGAKPLIEAAGKGLLSPAEIDMLQRPRSASAADAAWTPADIALLDEASWLLGQARSAPGERRHRTYGHIVVDEAQDLSPMELRMVARRSLSGSMTLVGDIAQATGPWAPSAWEDVMAHLPSRRGGWDRVSLSVSYRAPAEVMAMAARVLTTALPGAVPPEAVRHTGQLPRLVTGYDGAVPWAELIAATVGEEMAAVAFVPGDDAGEGEDGSVGVLVPADLLDEARSALVAGGIAFGEVGSGALDDQVSLLVLADAKGLEFDSVVVLEPARIAATPPQGMRALYVALTRCTRRLTVLAREPLPGPLRSGWEEALGERW